MHAEFRKALNLAARVVEEEAILFDGVATNFKFTLLSAMHRCNCINDQGSATCPSEDEGLNDWKEWEKFLIARGRSHSLRRLARDIRNIKQ